MEEVCFLLIDSAVCLPEDLYSAIEFSASVNCFLKETLSYPSSSFPFQVPFTNFPQINMPINLYNSDYWKTVQASC